MSAFTITEVQGDHGAGVETLQRLQFSAQRNKRGQLVGFDFGPLPRLLETGWDSGVASRPADSCARRTEERWGFLGDAEQLRKENISLWEFRGRISEKGQ